MMVEDIYTKSIIDLDDFKRSNTNRKASAEIDASPSLKKTFNIVKPSFKKAVK